MKKYYLLLLSVSILFGFAASAFAMHAEIPADTQAVVAKGQVRISLDGEFRIRGEYNNNTTDLNKDKADYTSLYDERIRLGLTANVTPNTTARIQLEDVDDSVATTDNTNKYYWGESDVNKLNTASAGIYPRGNSKRGPLNIREAWIQYTGSGLLGVPAGIKAGHMLLILGNGLFFNHDGRFGDDAIVLFADPVKELHLGLATIKLAEGNPASAGTAVSGNDDADAYVGFMSYQLNKDSNISADATFLNDQIAGVTQAKATSLPTVAAASEGTHFWNFGIRGNTQISGIGLKGDVELQTGKSKGVAAKALSGNTAVQSGDIKQTGYAALLGVSYTIDPVKLGFEGVYGSGDDNPNDNKNSTFITSLGAEPHYTSVYDHRVATAAGSKNRGIANTEYLKLSGEAGLTKDITANLSAYWLNAAKRTKIALSGVNTKGDSKDIGTEIDGKVSYAIDRNFSYYVEGGYLFAGNYYDTARKRADDAYVLRHGILLSF